MTANWGEIYRKHNLFIINDRWAIRDNSLKSSAAVIVHRCMNGNLSSIHDLIRYRYQCNSCLALIPDEIQALWLLHTCDNHDENWMKDGSGRIGE